MKNKKSYDITHRVMRVLAGDYALLLELSRRAGVSMAEALHLALESREREHEPEPELEKVIADMQKDGRKVVEALKELKELGKESE